MKKNKKITILAVLIVVMLVVWMPKGKRRAKTPPKSAPVTLEKAAPKIVSVQRKRTEFVDWGRNPFIWPKETANLVSELSLSGIIWDNQAPFAIINGAIVHTGEKIDGHTVKHIEPNKVILTDGSTDYTLELE